MDGNKPNYQNLNIQQLTVYQKKNYIDFVWEEFIFGEDIRFGRNPNHYIMGTRWLNKGLYGQRVHQSMNPFKFSDIMRSIWIDRDNINREYKMLMDEFDHAYYDDFFCSGSPKTKKRKRSTYLKREWNFLSIIQHPPKKYNINRTNQNFAYKTVNTI